MSAGSGVFYCLDEPLRIHRTMDLAEWPAAVKAIGEVCRHPDHCTQGGCQSVAREYLRGNYRRAQLLARRKGLA